MQKKILFEIIWGNISTWYIPIILYIYSYILQLWLIFIHYTKYNNRYIKNIIRSKFIYLFISCYLNLNQRFYPCKDTLAFHRGETTTCTFSLSLSLSFGTQYSYVLTFFPRVYYGHLWISWTILFLHSHVSFFFY